LADNDPYEPFTADEKGFAFLRKMPPSGCLFNLALQPESAQDIIRKRLVFVFDLFYKAGNLFIAAVFTSAVSPCLVAKIRGLI
jgi:hypothetical protein